METQEIIHQIFILFLSSTKKLMHQKQALKLNGVVIDGCKLKVKWKQPLLKQKCQSCCDSVRRQVDLVERERNLQILTGRYKHLFPVGQSTSAVT